MTEEIQCHCMSLPGDVRAFTVLKDDFYTIVVREELDFPARIRAYQHELDHIKNGDYQSALGAGMIEIFAHGTKLEGPIG